jgi:hypothetical protein
VERERDGEGEFDREYGALFGGEEYVCSGWGDWGLRKGKEDGPDLVQLEREILFLVL